MLTHYPHGKARNNIKNVTNVTNDMKRLACYAIPIFLENSHLLISLTFGGHGLHLVLPQDLRAHNQPTHKT